MRLDGRRPDQLRPVNFTLNYIIYPEGSVLIEQGNTRVLCNVSVEETIPKWMQNQNLRGGWITAEYSMLPRSTLTRTPRETNALSGRTHEIRRLIGRSLRMAVNLQQLESKTLTIDCDVLQADGGTRTAAITGAYVALVLALRKLKQTGAIDEDIPTTAVAAVSVGIVRGEPYLDLTYEEDHQAEVDLNVVMTERGEYIEIQGTAEAQPFSRSQLDQLLDFARKGILELIELQKQALRDY